MESYLEKAVAIATKAHEGQVDKAGQPYITHPIRVMESCSTEEEKICAVLHDVIEDTDITLEDLRAEGFSEEILTALSLVTKKEGEDYDAFIERICVDPLAIRVKLADLKDNMNLDRLSHPTDKDRERVIKYQKAYKRLSEVLERSIQ